MDYQGVTVGNIRFKPALSKANIQSLLSFYMKNLLNKDDWTIQPGKLTPARVIQIFQQADQVHLKKIKYLNNEPIPFSINLRGLHFTQLKQLHMSNSQICSFQMISTFNMPKLQNFNLSFNFISNFQSAKRLNLPQLTNLSLFSNVIVDMSSLENISFIKLTHLQAYMLLDKNQNQMVLGNNPEEKAKPSISNFDWLSKNHIKLGCSFSLIGTQLIKQRKKLLHYKLHQNFIEYN